MKKKGSVVKGTPAQFEGALERRIAELGGTVESSTNINASLDPDAERYIHTIIRDIQAEVQGDVESITFDQDDNNLIVTVVYNDAAVREFQVPFEDLHYDFDEIDADVTYVVNAILYDTDTYDKSINSATNTCGIPAAPNMDTDNAVTSSTDEDTSEWIEVSSKSVTDSDGMLTDYTWYRNQSGDKHIFMFGDKELYEPDESYADWECDSAEEAQEWFDSYNGFDEDDEYDVYGNSQPIVKCNRCGRPLNEMGTCLVCDEGEEDYDNTIVGGITMKRILKSSITAASSSGAILTSATGLFSLIEASGVGMNNTPWTGYRVTCSGLADKHVVEVKLDQIAQGDFDGNPVTYLPSFCHVAHGMRSRIDTGADTEEYIKVLQEALDFKTEIDSYFCNELAIPRYKVL